ncbi:hypothetical protein DPMN_005608 [Dreissena polymorpha]|uniref:Uncharacterized protein n=2 Tax=Dreissena polymorpha TaxID=45954 RepID=A0A9D4MTT9_DREPO|nr:hypothetical protein DPMN_005608 [Dreissena polymorpha]
MSDAIGSGFIFANTDDIGLHHGFVIYGFNESAFRVWTESQRYSQHHFFCGKDSTGFAICVSNGTLEIFAWKESTLSPTEKMEMLLGAQANETFDQEKLMSAKTSVLEYFVQLWAVARSGPNDNFRFLASGSMSGYRHGHVTPCTYGGLVFAYSNTTLRPWKPNSSADRAAIICILDVFAGGKYSQSTNDAFAVAHVWITLDHTLHEECTTSRDCWDAFSTCRYLTCQCEAGFTETHQDTNHTTTGCYVDGKCTHANETAGDCKLCHLPFDACHWPDGPPHTTHTNPIRSSASVRLYIIIGGSTAGLLTLVTIVTVLCLRQRKRKADRLNRYELMQTL